MLTIHIAKDFSTEPVGRYRCDSNSSGEAFREDKLLPSLKSLNHNETLKVIIDDGVEGYSASFLQEAFGGIVRDKHYSAKDLLSKLDISYKDEEYAFFEERIVDYIIAGDKL